MGTTTNGQICYGIVFEEDHEFPWDGEEYDDGINDWWKAVKGYEPPFKIYDEHGEYIDDVRPPVEDEDENVETIVIEQAHLFDGIQNYLACNVGTMDYIEENYLFKDANTPYMKVILKIPKEQ